MTEVENVEAGMNELEAQKPADELIDLGAASQKTRGLFFGAYTEISILPLRLS